jgi:hypothetical protein
MREKQVLVNFFSIYTPFKHIYVALRQNAWVRWSGPALRQS